MSMEVHTVNSHLNNSLRSQKSKTTSSSAGTTSLLSSSKSPAQLKDELRSISPTSSNSENEKEQNDPEVNCSDSLIINNSVSLIGADLGSKSNGSLSGASTSSIGGNITIDNGNGSPNTSNISCSSQFKKRISSSRTPTRKARRIKFYRNGDRFYPGITIPVSNERYRSFESLFEDLTRHLEENVKIPGAVRTIYTLCGKKISALDELEDGQSYVCSCNNESFKKVEYNTTSQPLANLSLSNKSSGRFSKVVRPSSPSKNGGLTSINTSTTSANGSSTVLRLGDRNSVVYPRIVTLIRNGTKPRKIMRLLLNKRNSPTFEHVLTAVTQVVKLDTGYVRKIFTLSGSPVLQLADFFSVDDVFFAYGTERVNNPDDFKLEPDEQKSIYAIRKTLRTTGTTCKGPKPKMPVKSKNIRDVPIDDAKVDEAAATLNELGINASDLPAPIRDRYVLGQIIGDGNFAVVLRVKDRITGLPYALKIIDKSKCKGKEHYIDAEVRVMKKLQHPHIISLIIDVDQTAYMYLVLEYISGGDLFDAITRVTRFSESQSRVMIKHLASAMAYLHSMRIVHRDIKPENLLVELDRRGNVIELKLADFGLACEVLEPMYAVCGTPTYVAPEILLENGYGLKIDVWAAGIILYILLCGFPPFVSPDNQQEPLFDAIISGIYEFPDPYWSDIGDGVRDLIANMLQSDPDVRFSSEDVLDHYWILNECNEDDSRS